MNAKKKRRVKLYLSIGETAEMLGFSANTIGKWASTGFLAGYLYRSGKRATWRFSRETILRLMQSAYRGKPESEQAR